jgi:putative salt-induced outer membrane protein
LASVSPAFAHEWKNESELGVVVVTGNSDTQSFNAKELTSYAWSANMFRLKGNFLQSKNRGALDARRWDAGLRYERNLSAIWSAYAGQSVESDRFAGYQQRHASDIGGKHWLYQLEKKFYWFAELGYRYQIENRTDGSKARNSILRAYTEANRDWKENFSSKVWLEYLPNLSNRRAWLFNGEASSSFALSTVFAVKIAYLLKYNNQPVNAKNTDTTYTTTLVAKF